MSGYTVVPNANRPARKLADSAPGPATGTKSRTTEPAAATKRTGTEPGAAQLMRGSLRLGIGVPNRSRGRAAGCNSVGLVVCVEPDQRQFRHYGHHVPVWREILPFRWFQPAPHCPANGDARQCGRAQAHIFFESRHRTLKSGYTQYLTEANQCGRARPAGVHGGHGRFFNAVTTKDQPALVIAAAIGGDWQVSSPTRS
jgi:hypothetical protein